MFHGSMVALVTPMNALGEIDYPALEKLVAFHLDNQTDGLVIAGTTGEAAALTFEEKRQLFKTAVKLVNQRIPVIAGTATDCTRSTVELTAMAMDCGVDGSLIMTPAYVRPTQHGIVAHYRAVAAAVSLPIIAYNVPSRTAFDLLPETLLQMADIPNLVGIKEATGEMWRVKSILSHSEDKLDVFSGDDATACELMCQGGKGVISVTANIAPNQMASMAKAALAGDTERAKAIDNSIARLHTALFVESNPIPVKWALQHLGLIDGGIRLPLTTLEAEHEADVIQALHAAI